MINMSRGKVVFWKNGTTDGCSFYRCDEPARALLQADSYINAISTKIMPDSVYRHADVVVGQRIAEEGPTELWRRLATGELGVRPKLIYEIDDDLLSVPESFGPVHAIYADPRRRENIRANIARADAVTVTNEHLAERAQRYTAADIHVIPNYVPERFVVDSVPERTGPLVIGWAGSGSHREDFEQVIAPLRKLIRAHAGTSVHIIGPDYANGLATSRTSSMDPVGFAPNDPVNVRHTPWVDGVPGYLAALDFHVGIAPLVDNMFNRSKSDIKLKEYAARGICSLASAVGPYQHRTRGGSPVPHLGVTGALDSTWPEWLDHLARDEWLVQDTANQALWWARENTLEKHIGEWEKVITE